MPLAVPGLGALLLIAFLGSEDKRRIPWRAVISRGRWPDDRPPHRPLRKHQRDASCGGGLTQWPVQGRERQSKP